MASRAKKLEQMQKDEFRKFCVRALKKMDFHRVRALTDDDRRSGIDIIAKRGGISYGIRCAVGQKAVGNAAVQDAYQGSRFFGLDVPVVLGNNVFSSDSVKLAEKRKVELWDGREMLADAFRKYCEKQDRKAAREKAWEEEVDREFHRMIAEAAEDEKKPYIEDPTKIHGFNDGYVLKKDVEEEPYIEDLTKIHGFNGDSPFPTVDSTRTRKYASAFDLSDELSADLLDDLPFDRSDYRSDDLSDDEHGYSPDSYVPDDFEPDLDPYDRQALYDEELVDDWVIAGGGNPFDFEDRMDALSDPFGFGGDGESGE